MRKKCFIFWVILYSIYAIQNKDVINIDKASTIVFDFKVSSVILLWRVCESCDNLPDPRATNISRSKTDDDNMNVLLLSTDKPSDNPVN